MRIENSQGTVITSLSDWAKLYDSPQTSHQWKEHRSAYSAAEFLMNRNGGATIQSRVSDAFGKSIEFERAIPEYEVRFDEFGRGRVHDIGIFGNTEAGESAFIGIEAKVDEPFGMTVHDAYLKAKAKQISGVSTNAPQRIEELLAMHFTKPDISMFDIRYQLLYATAETLAAGADISFLYIIVFKTVLYNEAIGAENFKDYIQFMSKVGARPVKLSNKEVHCHELSFQGKQLICLHECIEF
jgi:hypothetical protein